LLPNGNGTSIGIHVLGLWFTERQVVVLLVAREVRVLAAHTEWPVLAITLAVVFGALTVVGRSLGGWGLSSWSLGGWGSSTEDTALGTSLDGLAGSISWGDALATINVALQVLDTVSDGNITLLWALVTGVTADSAFNAIGSITFNGDVGAALFGLGIHLLVLWDTLRVGIAVLGAHITLTASLAIGVEVVGSTSALRPGSKFIASWGLRLALRVPVVDLHARVAFGT